MTENQCATCHVHSVLFAGINEKLDDLKKDTVEIKGIQKDRTSLCAIREIEIKGLKEDCEELCEKVDKQNNTIDDIKKVINRALGVVIIAPIVLQIIFYLWNKIPCK